MSGMSGEGDSDKKRIIPEDPEYDIIMENDKEIQEVDALVAGFPGTGLIGGIASEQLINTLELEQVASIDCDKFPPTAVIFDGIPRRPVRFFAGEGFLLVKSDMVISPDLAPSLSETILEFAMENNVEDAIIFDGIPKRDMDDEEGRKVWGVLSSHAAETEAEELDVEIISRGAISGISSSLLVHAHEMELKAVGMLVEGNPNMPDPRSSAKLLDKFADYRNIEIETETLIESAEQLEEQYAKMLTQANKANQDMDHSRAHPPLYG